MENAVPPSWIVKAMSVSFNKFKKQCTTTLATKTRMRGSKKKSSRGTSKLSRRMLLTAAQVGIFLSGETVELNLEDMQGTSLLQHVLDNAECEHLCPASTVAPAWYCAHAFDVDDDFDDPDSATFDACGQEAHSGGEQEQEEQEDGEQEVTSARRRERIRTLFRDCKHEDVQALLACPRLGAAALNYW